jgi:hypothetical protein
MSDINLSTRKTRRAVLISPQPAAEPLWQQCLLPAFLAAMSVAMLVIGL